MDFVVDGWECKLDDDVGEWLVLTKLAVRRNKGRGSGTKGCYLYANDQAVHRLVYSLTGNRVLSGNVVDHINTKSLDNRRINLRQLTNYENYYKHPQTCCRGKHYIGVKFNYTRGVWQAFTQIDGYRGKSGLIGDFETELEAAKARDRFMVTHPQFPLWINFPEDYPKIGFEWYGKSC